MHDTTPERVLKATLIVPSAQTVERRERRASSSSAARSWRRRASHAALPSMPLRVTGTPAAAASSSERNRKEASEIWAVDPVCPVWLPSGVARAAMAAGSSGSNERGWSSNNA